MSPYRLAFVIARYFQFGGLQRDFLRIVERCIELGHEGYVITGDWDGSQPNDLTVRVVDTHALTNHGSHDKLAAQVACATASNRFDCVVGFNKIPGLDVYYAGDQCLAEKIDANSLPIKRFLPRYRRLLQQEASVFNSSRDTQILLIAHLQREAFMRSYGTPAERFSLLPPGIDRDRLVRSLPNEQHRQSLRRELGVGDGELMLLQVGSGFRTKGVDRTIGALADLPEILRSRSRLIIVGEGQSRPLRKMAKAMAVHHHVKFVGARGDVADFFHAADLLIHPARTENTGTVLLEAMICGLTVIATGNCGYAFHVERANGGIVLPHPFNKSTLHDAIITAADPHRRIEWSAGGRNYCDETDLYSMIDKAAELIVDRARRNRQRQRTQ